MHKCIDKCMPGPGTHSTGLLLYSGNNIDILHLILAGSLKNYFGLTNFRNTILKVYFPHPVQCFKIIHIKLTFSISSLESQMKDNFQFYFSFYIRMLINWRSGA